MTNSTQHRSIHLGWLGNISPKYLVVAIVITTLGYLVQINSPLRLNSDNSNLLTMAYSYIHTGDYLVNGRESHLPSGYPFFVYILDKIGAANAFGLVLVNIGLIGVGIISFVGIIKKGYPRLTKTSPIICLLTLMSFVVLKYSALAQSEALFFATSLLALRCGIGIEGTWSRRLFYWALFAILSGISIWVRTIGIFLIPAVAASLYPVLFNQNFSKFIEHINRRHLTLIILIIIGLFCGIYALVHETLYWEYLFRGYIGNFDLLISHLAGKLTVLFQLFGNIPPRFIDASPIALNIICGLFLLFSIFTGFWAVRKKIGIIEIYLGATIGALFLWPAVQPRFWMAILPFLFLYGIIGLEKALTSSGFQFLMKTWVLGFIVLGIAGLSYSISLTLDRDTFPSRYGNQVLTEVYRAAMDGTCPKNINSINYLAYQALMRFDPSMKPAKIKCVPG